MSRPSRIPVPTRGRRHHLRTRSLPINPPTAQVEASEPSNRLQPMNIEAVEGSTVPMGEQSGAPHLESRQDMAERRRSRHSAMGPALRALMEAGSQGGPAPAQPPTPFNTRQPTETGDVNLSQEEQDTTSALASLTELERQTGPGMGVAMHDEGLGLANLDPPPYLSPPTPAPLSSASQAAVDLGRALLRLVGDNQTEQMRAMVEQYFNLYRPHDTQLREATATGAIRDFDYRLSDIMQARLRGHLNARRQTHGASEESIIALELVPLDKLREGDDHCLICMDPYSISHNAANDISNGVLRMPCGHIFGGRCLVIWLEGNNTCPVCRAELPTNGSIRGRGELSPFVPQWDRSPISGLGQATSVEPDGYPSFLGVPSRSHETDTPWPGTPRSVPLARLPNAEQSAEIERQFWAQLDASRSSGRERGAGINHQHIQNLEAVQGASGIDISSGQWGRMREVSSTPRRLPLVPPSSSASPQLVHQETPTRHSNTLGSFQPAQQYPMTDRRSLQVHEHSDSDRQVEAPRQSTTDVPTIAAPRSLNRAYSNPYARTESTREIFYARRRLSGGGIYCETRGRAPREGSEREAVHRLSDHAQGFAVNSNLYLRELGQRIRNSEGGGVRASRDTPGTSSGTSLFGSAQHTTPRRHNSAPETHLHGSVGGRRASLVADLGSETQLSEGSYTGQIPYTFPGYIPHLTPQMVLDSEGRVQALTNRAPYVSASPRDTGVPTIPMTTSAHRVPYVGREHMQSGLGMRRTRTINTNTTGSSSNTPWPSANTDVDGSTSYFTYDSPTLNSNQNHGIDGGELGDETNSHPAP